MCEENRLRLIPVVILIAALIAGLIIAFVPTPGAVFPYALLVSLGVLLTTAVITAVCGFRRTLGENDSSRCTATCVVLRCLGPIILITAFLSIVLALIVIAGFSITPLINAILGIIYALIFSTMLVYFVDLFLELLDI